MTEKTLLETINDLVAGVPKEEWDKLPRDLSEGFPKMVENRDRRIAELEAALRDVVRDVNDYERVNNLHPNPGRTECWDSVARAKKLITI